VYAVLHAGCRLAVNWLVRRSAAAMGRYRLRAGGHCIRTLAIHLRSLVLSATRGATTLTHGLVFGRIGSVFKSFEEFGYLEMKQKIGTKLSGLNNSVSVSSCTGQF
jgi:hypothetical protein